jgi:hypothetical protein
MFHLNWKEADYVSKLLRHLTLYPQLVYVSFQVDNGAPVQFRDHRGVYQLVGKNAAKRQLLLTLCEIITYSFS